MITNIIRVQGYTRSQAVVLPHSTYGGHVTSSVTWPFDSPYANSYRRSFGTKPLSLTVSEIFNAECSAMVGMTLIRPLTMVKVIHVGTNRFFIIYDFLEALNSNICSRTHRLATIQSRYRRRWRQTTDRRNTVPIARPLVRSAKN